jgi:hypothetical protein
MIGAAVVLSTAVDGRGNRSAMAEVHQGFADKRPGSAYVTVFVTEFRVNECDSVRTAVTIPPRLMID